MSTRRKAKLAEERRKAVEMYVHGGAAGGAPGGSGAVTQPAVSRGGGITDVELERAGPIPVQLSDHYSVSSEDEREAVDLTPGAAGELGAAEIDPGLEVEPETAAGEESAAEAAAAPDEERFLLDAWHASYSDAGQRAMAIAQAEMEESLLEVVIGEDDRIRVTNVSAFPWRVICSLRIRAADGSNWIGTAWLVGRRTLITAGHCVYMHDRGGWAANIEVIPGRNAAEMPFGSCPATSFRSVAGWTQRKQREFDYGAIILPEECTYGDELGFFGIANLSDLPLRQLTINLSGYPGDKPPGTHWYHSRRISTVGSSVFSYDIDTAGGQSGAPVWRLRNGQRHVVGIHTNGSPTGNSATRINWTVYQNITQWRDEGEG
jgi:glutamyl endopeptidase